MQLVARPLRRVLVAVGLLPSALQRLGWLVEEVEALLVRRLEHVVVRVQEPVFESQTKTKLGSNDMAPGGPGIREFVGKFMQQSLDVYLHKNREMAEALKRKIEESERERKELAGIRNLARERAKKASLHNRKLRDCRVHLGERSERAEESTLFIVEGDSAAGSLTATRDVQTQAVFALTQMPDGQGTTRLIEVARTNRNPEVRKQAMFWLGQSHDPRALAFIEKVLTE